MTNELIKCCVRLPEEHIEQIEAHGYTMSKFIRMAVAHYLRAHM